MSRFLAPLLERRPQGPYAPAFDAFVDPPTPSPRAILSHAHADHAVPGHGEVWATAVPPSTLRRTSPGFAPR